MSFHGYMNLFLLGGYPGIELLSHSQVPVNSGRFLPNISKVVTHRLLFELLNFFFFKRRN